MMPSPNLFNNKMLNTSLVWNFRRMVTLVILIKFLIATNNAFDI
jgi:hypothetical protein